LPWFSFCYEPATSLQTPQIAINGRRYIIQHRKDKTPLLGCCLSRVPSRMFGPIVGDAHCMLQRATATTASRACFSHIELPLTPGTMTASRLSTGQRCMGTARFASCCWSMAASALQ